MKQPKKLTRSQKELLASHKKDPLEWMLLLETCDSITFIHKQTKQKLCFDK